MTTKQFNFIKTKAVFPFLLCLFFVLHGFTENYDFIPVKDALLLTGLYFFVTAILIALSWIYFRNIIKASLLAFLIMTYHFFFGAVHDFIKNVSSNGFISKYSFILSFSAIAFLFLLIAFKKTKNSFSKINYYLNVLLIILLIIDSGWLITKILKSNKSITTSLPSEFTNPENTNRPDVFLIVADEYAGNAELKDIFDFDNSLFTDSLKSRNFHTIPYSRSNYNYTPFAIASLLNMNYLKLENKERGQTDLAYCYKLIKQNALNNFLDQRDYHFYNYSVFDFPGQPAPVNETFLPVKTRLITSQTFLSRLNRDIRFNLITRLKSKSEIKKLTYANLKNNNNIYDLTWKMAEEKSESPKFVYTHLMMPHYPYYFDKNGNELPFEKLGEGNQSNQDAYIEYLQYCNKKFLSLIDHILESSSKPPVIVLMGDHGFRHFKKPVENDYYFLNHVSVHIPGENNTAFPDSLTTVNLFRTILNREFGQNLGLLSDSTIYLRD